MTTRVAVMALLTLGVVSLHPPYWAAICFLAACYIVLEDLGVGEGRDGMLDKAWREFWGEW